MDKLYQQRHTNTLSQTQFDALMAGYVITNSDDHWHQVLDWMRVRATTGKGTGVSNAAVSCAAVSGAAVTVDVVPLQKSTYVACLQACLDHAQHAERSVQILEVMRTTAASLSSTHVLQPPDSHQYSLCILALCRKQSSLWRQALALQKQFVQSQHQESGEQPVEMDLPIHVYDAIFTAW